MKLLQSFSWGIIAALGALFLEIFVLIFSNPLSINQEAISKELFSLNTFFFATILIEEIVKYLVITRSLSKISHKMNVLYNAFFFGIGFALLEMTLLYLNFQAGDPIDFLGISGILAVHISASLLIALSSFKFSSHFKKIVFGLFPALFIHFLYNLINVAEINPQKELVFLLLIALTALDIFILALWLFTREKEDF